MLKRANIQWSGKTLTNQIERGNVSFDCAVQRGYVWDNEKNSLLMHSMIEGYPIPAFYFSKNDNGVYDALDGKQRSNAISNYIKGNYSLCDSFEVVTDENGQEYHFGGMTFDELPEWAQDAIKDYSLTIYYFESLTIEERDNMFFRLNNGKPLTAIELTRVKAKSLELFQEIAQHELVKLAVTDKGRIRYNHENLAMQAWAICFADDVSFDTKTFRNIVESANVEQAHVLSIKACFDILLDIYNSYDANDRTQKRMQKRIITRTHTVALTKAVYVAMAAGYDMDSFKVWAKDFFSGTTSASINDIYNNSFGAGSARKDKVDARMNAIVNSMTAHFVGNNATNTNDSDNIITVPFFSVWEGNEAVETTASVNIDTGEITDIVVVGTDDDFEILERQYIVLNDEQIEVYDDEGDFEFWADIHGTYKNGVTVD